jgi:hypothetical protein
MLADQQGKVMDEHRRDGSNGSRALSAEKKPFIAPELIKHDEPLHEVVMNPFDPQVPLAE